MTSQNLIAAAPSSIPYQSIVTPSSTQEEIDRALDLVEQMRELQKDRCEWQVEGFRKKLMKMPHGSSIKSEPFSLLGVEDCFLEIYPLGDSVENIGYVSLYLGCPPGLDVLFTLWIGDVTTRPLLHKFEDQGEHPPVWGYPRMCTADDLHRVLGNSADQDTLTVGVEFHKIRIAERTTFLRTS